MTRLKQSPAAFNNCAIGLAVPRVSATAPRPNLLENSNMLAAKHGGQWIHSIEEDSHANRILFLPATENLLCRRAATGRALPLPRLPETDRQHIQRRRLLSARQGEGRRRRWHIQALGAERPPRDFPFLPQLRLERLLGARAKAGMDCRRGWLLCRPGISGAIK